MISIHRFIEIVSQLVLGCSKGWTSRSPVELIADAAAAKV